MSATELNFRDRLYSEVTLIYKKGFRRPVEPKCLPALTELALCLEDAPSYDGPVENAIQKAIVGAAPRLLSVVNADRESDIRTGLELLLGIPEDSPKGLEKRRDEAAASLGYLNYDGNQQLRKAAHKKRWVTDWIIEELHAELIHLGAQANFSKIGWYLDNELSPAVPVEPTPSEDAPELVEAIAGLDLYIETAPPRTARHRRLVSLFSSIFLGDLLEVSSCGFDVLCESPYRIAPHISTLAYICVGEIRPVLRDHPLGPMVDWGIRHPRQVSARELDALLHWAVRQLPNPNKQAGVVELLGIGDVRGLESKERKERACEHLGVADTNAFSRDSTAALNLVADSLTQLAISSEFETLFSTDTQIGAETRTFAFGNPNEDSKVSRL